MNMSRKTLAWANKEVETFLCILGEEDVQRELDGAVRNEKVFQLVSGRMAIAGYEKNTEQCRQKCKKLRAEYPKVNDHNNRRGVDRKMWKWFNIMDATQSTDTDRRVEEERGPSTRPPLCSSPCWSLPVRFAR
jgi:hypothetical protein